ncbi:MAG: hypothetical protein QW584_00970 [Thermofilaceae archaeon]
MWTFTGYILWKFYEAGRQSIALGELARFVFGYLWKNYNMIFVDSVEELKMELEYMEKLGYIDLENGVLTLKEKLKDFYSVVGCSPLARESKLYREYIERIDEAVAEYLGTN